MPSHSRARARWVIKTRDRPVLAKHRRGGQWELEFKPLYFQSLLEAEDYAEHLVITGYLPPDLDPGFEVRAVFDHKRIMTFSPRSLIILQTAAEMAGEEVSYWSHSSRTPADENRQVG